MILPAEKKVNRAARLSPAAPQVCVLCNQAPYLPGHHQHSPLSTHATSTDLTPAFLAHIIRTWYLPALWSCSGFDPSFSRLCSPDRDQAYVFSCPRQSPPHQSSSQAHTYSCPDSLSASVLTLRALFAASSSHFLHKLLHTGKKTY